MTDCSFSCFTLLSEDDVRKLIQSMPSKSCSSDPMPTSIVKELLDTLITPLTNLVNTSLQEGIFAPTWKVAVIRPLVKKLGLELVLKNYRPVSNLTFVSKLVEKAFLTQLKLYLSMNELEAAHQSAYRENHSCETALVYLVDKILWNMEAQRVSTVLAIDLSAAFDTVDHTTLLEVMCHRYGIQGSALHWIDNYLRPRWCRVELDKASSDLKEIFLLLCPTRESFGTGSV